MCWGCERGQKLKQRGREVDYSSFYDPFVSWEILVTAAWNKWSSHIGCNVGSDCNEAPGVKPQLPRRHQGSVMDTGNGSSVLKTKILSEILWQMDEVMK